MSSERLWMLEWQNKHANAFSNLHRDIKNNRRSLFDRYLRELNDWMKVGYKKKVRETLLKIRDQWRRFKDCLKRDIIPPEKMKSTKERMETTLSTMISLYYLKPKRKKETDPMDPSQPAGRKRINLGGQGGLGRVSGRQQTIARTGSSGPTSATSFGVERPALTASTSSFQGPHGRQALPWDISYNLPAERSFEYHPRGPSTSGTPVSPIDFSFILSGQPRSQPKFTMAGIGANPTQIDLPILTRTVAGEWFVLTER
jgi:hypothetical protein